MDMPMQEAATAPAEGRAVWHGGIPDGRLLSI